MSQTSSTRYARRLFLCLLSCLVLGSQDQLAQATPPLSSDILTPAPSIHPELARHTKHFAKKIYKIGPNVYSAVGYSLGNVIMIVGTDGVIIVDTGTTPGEAAPAIAALRKISDKPVKAVVYTHFHPDHWGGVKAIVSEAEVASGKVRVFSHKTTLDHVIFQGGDLGPIMAMRAAYTFGVLLPPSDTRQMNDGIGPKTHSGQGSFIRPTDLVDDFLEQEIAGIRLHFIHVPSESPDEIAVYLPDSRILMSGEAIQGPTLPNIHTLRGTKFRDPVQWYKSLDKLRHLKPRHMVPSHGQPVYGAENVEQVLRQTRDGIQYIHDQTLRLMNQGLNEDQLAHAIKLPPALANSTPYLREYYGTVKHAVRQIYTGYLGWFSGDPVDLDPLPQKTTSTRYITLMGGQDAVLKAAATALNNKENQWAAELATHVIRIDHNHKLARKIKAVALRRQGYASMNTNWRNWYLTAAQELEGHVDPLEDLKKIAANFSSPDIIAQWPLRRVISGLSSRLNPARRGPHNIILSFHARDTGERHSLELRGAIAQFHPQMAAKSDATLVAPRNVLLAVIMGRISLADAEKAGTLKVTGDRAKAHQALNTFDPVLSPIQLVVR